MIICGIDEAGRGPLAGPVYAASVILNDNFPVELLNDSKKMTQIRRGEARIVIMREAFAWGIGSASHTEIDEINILQASLLAMKRAFENMLKKYDLKDRAGKKALPLAEIMAIVDGKFAPNIGVSCTPMIKADAQIPQVMAASILAKTERDMYMDEMAKMYPKYGYEKHKGYPTKAHRDAVLKHGPSPIQRMSFKVKE